jgi:hypothetical protein
MADQTGVLYSPHSFSPYTVQAIGNTVRKNEKSKESNSESPVDAVKKIEVLADQSNNILHKSSSIFPFTLFPTDIVIDEVKVNILYRNFFNSGQIESIAISDIMSVHVETSVFFAMIRIESYNFPDKPVEVRYLKKSDATHARKIIQGLMILAKEEVDYSKIDRSYLKEKLEEVGKTNSAI